MSEPTRPELAAMSDADLADRILDHAVMNGSVKLAEVNELCQRVIAAERRCQPPAPADAGADDVRNAALDRANFLLRNCERTLQLCWRDMKEWVQFGRYNTEGIIPGSNGEQTGPLPEPAHRPSVEGINKTDQNVTVIEEALQYIHKHIAAVESSPPRPGGTPEADVPDMHRKAVNSLTDLIRVSGGSVSPQGYRLIETVVESLLAAPRPEPAANAPGDAETLALFQRFDCDWGCGCGKNHCAGADRPCKSCLLEKAEAENAELRRITVDRILAASKPSADVLAAAERLARNVRETFDHDGQPYNSDPDIETVTSYVLSAANGRETA